MSKQKNQLLILVVLIVAGALYAYIQYLFLPQFAVLKEETAHLAERKAYLTKLEENFKILPSLKEQVKVLTAQAGELSRDIPLKADKPDIMLSIYNMAKDNGLNPLSLNYSPVKEEAGIITMGMDFTCTGPEENVYALVEKFFEDNKYIFALDSISINPGEGGVSAKMHLVAYFYRQEL